MSEPEPPIPLKPRPADSINVHDATMAIGWLASELDMDAHELYALWLRALRECAE